MNNVFVEDSGPAQTPRSKPDRRVHSLKYFAGRPHRLPWKQTCVRSLTMPLAPLIRVIQARRGLRGGEGEGWCLLVDVQAMESLYLSPPPSPLPRKPLSSTSSHWSRRATDAVTISPWITLPTCVHAFPWQQRNRWYYRVHFALFRQNMFKIKHRKTVWMQ